ncbi:MAG: hypothetical protein GY859_25560, partial [Desulfobacterales bacterium]|nr:hypothetical protein [Desulfobacterales bacterium]
MNEIDMDRRLEAFCSPESPEVFFPVVGGAQIRQDDPFDVACIHAEARETFHGILAKSAAAPSPGRMLLILGESGTGKTHLMRYFRGYVQGRGLGYFGYAQS